MWSINRQTDKQSSDGHRAWHHIVEAAEGMTPSPWSETTRETPQMQGGCLMPAPVQATRGWGWCNSWARGNQSLQIKEKRFIRLQQERGCETGGVHHTAKDPAPGKEGK